MTEENRVEATPLEDRVQLTPEETRAQRRRSVAIAMVLVALIVVFYVVTVIRMSST